MINDAIPAGAAQTVPGLFGPVTPAAATPAAVAGSGIPRLQCPDRAQIVAVFESLDQRLPEGHQARLVWEFVASADLAPLYAAIQAVEGRAGRPPIDPRILLALLLYATLDGVGSAREIARLCGEHDAYRWLCGGVGVNYHTISDFRTAHVAVLERLLTDSVAALVHEGLVTLERVAQDGVRVRASAGADSFRRRATLVECQKEAREQVAKLREELEGDPSVASKRQQAAWERAARERAERVQRALEEVQELERKRAAAAAAAGGSGVAAGDAKAKAAGVEAAPSGAAEGATGPDDANKPPNPDSSAAVEAGGSAAAEGATATDDGNKAPNPGSPAGVTPAGAAATEDAKAQDDGDKPEDPSPSADAGQDSAAGQGKEKKPKEPRASTTDADAHVMKMGDGGFRPAYNVQLATDTDSRIITGADVITSGSDQGQMVPMLEQHQERYEAVPNEVLVDGGFATKDDIERASSPGLGATVYAPVQKPRKEGQDRYARRPGDSDAVAAWRARMGTEAGQAIYKERASTAEWSNAMARNRGLQQFLVRGLAKVKAVVLLFVLAHNLIQAAVLRAAAAVAVG